MVIFRNVSLKVHEVWVGVTLLMVQKSHSQPPRMVLKPIVSHGVNYPSLNWWKNFDAGFRSHEASTVFLNQPQKNRKLILGGDSGFSIPKNRRNFTSKMDGENNGKPYESWDDLGVPLYHYFWKHLLRFQQYDH